MSILVQCVWSEVAYLNILIIIYVFDTRLWFKFNVAYLRYLNAAYVSIGMVHLN